jgi:predicted flap endonuclease-1-like 5' DNA nuclease
MGATLRAWTVAAAIALFPASAAASHYDLSSIDLVDTDVQARLAKQKIATTEDLWKATATPAQVSRLARSTRVPAAQLREWHDFCDLLRLSGVGPKVARVLSLSGVVRLEHVAAQEPAALTQTIKTTNAGASILGKLPDEDTVRTWIEQARQLTKKLPAR